MEHISKHLQEMGKAISLQPARNNYLQKFVLPTCLTPQETQMVELKYSQPMIATLSDDKRLTACHKLILILHVITGWPLPANEMLDILIDQLQKKLAEDYGHMNAGEIEYAFRHSGTTVKDWGKTMNLSLIDVVLMPYMYRREELSTIEEKLLPPPAQKILSDDQLLNENRAITEACYQRFLAGDIKYFPVQLMKETLMADKIIDETQPVQNFFHAWAGSGFKNIYTKSE